MNEGILFGIVAALAWGTADFLVAAAKTDGVKIFFLSRIVSAALLTVVMLALFDLPALSMGEFSIVVVCGAFMTLGYGSFFTGLQKGRVSVVSPLGVSWPAITVILGFALLGEILSLPDYAGIAAVLVGAAVVSMKQEKARKRKSGVMYGLVAMLSWGIALFLMYTLIPALGWFMPVYLVMLASLAFSGVYVLYKESAGALSGMTGKIAAIGVLEALAFLAYGFGSSLEYLSIIAPLVAIVPAVTVILARIFLKENVGYRQALGIALVIAGLALLSL